MYRNICGDINFLLNVDAGGVAAATTAKLKVNTNIMKCRRYCSNDMIPISSINEKDEEEQWFDNDCSNDCLSCQQL